MTVLGSVNGRYIFHLTNKKKTKDTKYCNIRVNKISDVKKILDKLGHKVSYYILYKKSSDGKWKEVKRKW